MNHILLPGRASIDLVDDAARYGVNSMEHLINRLIELGAPRRRLTAKIFGGGHIIAGIGEEDSPGFKNAEFISRFLEVEKIPIVGRDLGGYQARRIYFHTDTGDVYLKRISVFKTTKQLLEEEKRYRRKVEKEIREPGSITLFD